MRRNLTVETVIILISLAVTVGIFGLFGLYSFGYLTPLVLCRMILAFEALAAVMNLLYFLPRIKQDVTLGMVLREAVLVFASFVLSAAILRILVPWNFEKTSERIVRLYEIFYFGEAITLALNLALHFLRRLKIQEIMLLIRIMGAAEEKFARSFLKNIKKGVAICKNG